ncbi:MAG: D-alanyl-D-alanine carboxypeptidase family protein [Egibacteraceae bacterium]
MTSPLVTPPVTSAVEHWSFQVDSPFRGPGEIRELADRPPADLAGKATVESQFGEDLAQAEDEFEAYDAYEQSSEDEAYDEAALTEADLLEEAPASSHPLAAVFSLPRLAFDAMAKGGWATGIAVAVGAGLRDVNQLTNLVFWFQHPELTGQKLRADQRDLAREWLCIRDEIVRPALAGTPGSAPTPAPASGPTGARRTSIPADGLRWFGPPGEETPELMAFMRKVYALHVKRSKGDFIDTLPESALDDVVPGKKARKDTAAKAREMLAAANTALAAEGLTGSVRIGVLSAYRSADHQFDIWQGKTTKGAGGFPFYYAATKAARKSPRFGGEHSDKAAAYLAAHMAECVAAPGYSNHQDGLALDFGTRKGKGRLVKVYKGSWFHNWLRANAHHYHFTPLASEAWHWTYRPPAGASEFESEFESWPREESTPTAVPAGRLEVARVPLLAGHRGRSPDLVLRWNDMPSVPVEIDVVVHLHGYSGATMTLPEHMEVWAGLDLGPVDGASGTGRIRPTLTVLPRGHFTGVQAGKIYRYTFPALTTRDGLSTLLGVALERFSDRVGGTPPKVGRLILTAHSGGGAPLMQLLRRHDPHEVHVFDDLSQDSSPLAEWARRHIRADRRAVEGGAAPTSAMRVFFGPSTRGYSLRLDRALAADLRDAPASVRDRYRVESSRLGHWQIARQYGWRMLADPSADVPDATRPPATSAAKQSFELDTAEIPFLPEGVEAEDSWEAGDEEEAWELGESDTEGEADLEFEDSEFGKPEFRDLEHPEREEPKLEGPELEDPELEDPESKDMEHEDPEAEAENAFERPPVEGSVPLDPNPDLNVLGWTELQRFAPGRARQFTEDRLSDGRERWLAANRPLTTPGDHGLSGLIDELTSLVFYNLHPELEGRQGSPTDEHLASEWETVRDRTVRPSLEADSPEDSLTDAVFSARHPDLAGTVADQPELAAEWKEIQDRHVRPLFVAQVGGLAPGMSPLPVGSANSRRLFLVLNHVLRGLPSRTLKAMEDEIKDIFAFIGKASGHRPTSLIVAGTDRLPQGLNFSDSVVSLVDTDVSAHLSQALRLQRRNVEFSLRRLGFKVPPNLLYDRIAGVPERIGQATSAKRIATAGSRKLAIPLMAAGVVLGEVVSEVINEVATGRKAQEIGQRRKGSAFENVRYWASAQALIDTRHLVDIDTVRNNRGNPSRWLDFAQDMLGAALGRAVAHEARHLYVMPHAVDGLGSDAPQLLAGAAGSTRFSPDDQSDILAAIKSLEAKQGKATVVATFPVKRRSFGLPF